MVVIAGQAKKLVGVPVEATGAIVQVWQVATNLGQAHPLTATLGGGCLVALVLLRRYARSVPASLVVLLAAVAISAAAGVADHGVAVVGGVTGGLPVPAPNADWVRKRVLALAAEREPALRCVIVDAEAFFYLDSTAAAALARPAVDLRARACQLSIARARSAVLTTLHTNPYEDGAPQHLPSFPSVRAAFLATQSTTR